MAGTLRRKQSFRRVENGCAGQRFRLSESRAGKPGDQSGVGKNKKQEEAEKVEPLTVKPQTRIYGMLDGVKFYLNRPTVFQKAELKSYVNEQGEKLK